MELHEKLEDKFAKYFFSFGRGKTISDQGNVSENQGNEFARPHANPGILLPY